MHFQTLASLALLPAGLALAFPMERRADNSVQVSSYCSKDDFATPKTKRGHRYTFDTNQWAWQEGQPGSLCMKVSEFANHTYSVPKTAPPFSITWQYPKGPIDQPVHAFPRVALNQEAKNIPAALGSIKHAHVNVEWSYGLGSAPISSVATDIQGMASKGVNTNVVIDMFADYDEQTALDASSAAYEIMVWFAMVGTAAPIGYPHTIMSRTVHGTTFNLHAGKNFAGQEVLTWLAKEQVTHFKGDIAPLLTDLGPSGPDASAYLGSMAFGTEAFDTPTDVTLNVPHLAMSIGV